MSGPKSFSQEQTHCLLVSSLMALTTTPDRLSYMPTELNMFVLKCHTDIQKTIVEQEVAFNHQIQSPCSIGKKCPLVKLNQWLHRHICVSFWQQQKVGLTIAFLQKIFNFQCSLQFWDLLAVCLVCINNPTVLSFFF